MIDWSAIRTAYKVATLGTVSAAAEELGMHRASVVRHIDALEKQLGQKIFIRNRRGYQPTEIGRDLIDKAGVAELNLNMLIDNAQSPTEKLSGELVISSVEFHPPLILPAIAHFQTLHPEVCLRLLSGEHHAAQLEYGDSHIVIQPIRVIKHPDYIVQKIGTGEIRLYASKKYIEQYGLPRKEADFKAHRFFKPAQRGVETEFSKWLASIVPPENFNFTANSFELAHRAIIAGISIGFFPTLLVGENDELVGVLPEKPGWDFPYWAVTHRDVHHTPKVQAFLKILKRSLRSS